MLNAEKPLSQVAAHNAFCAAINAEFNMATPESNNVLSVDVSGLSKTLREAADEIKCREGYSGIPRILFILGHNKHRLGLFETAQGFRVSGSVNGETSYRLNTSIFCHTATIGSVVRLMLGVHPAASVEELYA